MVWEKARKTNLSKNRVNMRTEANRRKIIAANGEPKQAVELYLPAEYCLKYRSGIDQRTCGINL